MFPAALVLLSFVGAARPSVPSIARNDDGGQGKSTWAKPKGPKEAKDGVSGVSSVLMSVYHSASAISFTNKKAEFLH